MRLPLSCLLLFCLSASLLLVHAADPLQGEESDYSSQLIKLQAANNEITNAWLFDSGECAAVRVVDCATHTAAQGFVDYSSDRSPLLRPPAGDSAAEIDSSEGESFNSMTPRMRI